MAMKHSKSVVWFPLKQLLLDMNYKDMSYKEKNVMLGLDFFSTEIDLEVYQGKLSLPKWAPNTMKHGVAIRKPELQKYFWESRKMLFFRPKTMNKNFSWNLEYMKGTDNLWHWKHLESSI